MLKFTGNAIAHFHLSIFLTILVCLLFLDAGISGQEISRDNDWELEKDKGEIKIYSRKVNQSRYKEFKGETVLDTSFTAVLGLLNDVAACKHWIHLCAESKTLSEKLGEKGFERIIYQVTDLPFPASNRDNIYKATVIWSKNNKSVRIQLESLPDYLEKTSNIRVIDSYGEYKAEPLEGNKVKLTWKHFVNPGGRLPSFIVNILSVNIPYKSLRNFRRLVEQPQYQALEFDYDGSNNIIGFKKEN